MSDSVITITVIAILVLFFAWALAPTVRANRTRILRSPATWSVVVLLLAILWMQWEHYTSNREMEAINASLNMTQKLTEHNLERANEQMLRAYDERIKERDRQLNGN
jgi:NO-binding membrane sensor protein with MHYT domain